MKRFKKLGVIIMVIIILLTNVSSIHNVSAPPPPPRPDQFITEIFPNSTAPLQLINTDTILTFNAINFPDRVDVQFDANYTIYNQENTTTTALILPFSLAVNATEVTIEVFANNTPISHELITVLLWNETIILINVSLTMEFIEIYPDTIYPINLIKSNVTLIKNSTSIIRIRLNWSDNNLFDQRDVFFMIYHVGTSQEWIGDATGRVEHRAYGKQPVFSRCYITAPPCQVVDIIGGKSFICEWNNTISPLMDVGVIYYGLSDNGWNIILIVNISINIGIVIIIMLVIFIRRNRRKIRSM